MASRKRKKTDQMAKKQKKIIVVNDIVLKQMSIKKVLFVTDFDGTLTQVDTTYLSYQACRKFIEGSEEDRASLLETWDERAVKFFTGYQKIFNSTLNDLVASNKGVDGVQTLLETLDEYNTESRLEIATKKMFDDVTTVNLQKFAERVEYHSNALDVLGLIKNSLDGCGECKILSVNWFKPLLVESLKDIIKDTKDITTAGIPVFRSDGSIELGPVSTSTCKRDWMQTWCKEDNYAATIYVGDSLTDLLALLVADYGIVFGNNEKVFQVANVFGIHLKPLSDILSADTIQKSNSENVCLYYTKQWNEILKLVKFLRQ